MNGGRVGATRHGTQILEKGSWQRVGVMLGSEELKGFMAPKTWEVRKASNCAIVTQPVV